MTTHNPTPAEREGGTEPRCECGHVRSAHKWCFADCAFEECSTCSCAQYRQAARSQPPEITGGQGHNKPCYYCGEPCNGFAGDPGLWPLAFCHRDEPGVMRWHHSRCVTRRLVENQPPEKGVVEALRAALKPFADAASGYEDPHDHHNYPDDFNIAPSLKVKHLRAAREALSHPPAPAMVGDEEIDRLCRAMWPNSDAWTPLNDIAIRSFGETHWAWRERENDRARMRAFLAATALSTPEARAQGWRPIETAPKDGRSIIVGRDMGDFGWIIGTSHWADIQGISGWISRGLGLYGELGLAHPTHWQPLPAAPSRESPPPSSQEATNDYGDENDEGRIGRAVERQAISQ